MSGQSFKSLKIKDERKSVLKLSIVIPVKHQNDTLKSTIESVLSQRYKNFEVIVSNGSVDLGVKNLVESFSEPRLVTLNLKTK